jgi:tRNA nucleotidyltransferase (CCA-adding enzyme)
MLFARYEVRIDGNSLFANAWGEPIDENKHELGVEVKGATCTELKVARDQDGGWIAQCVVDV